MHIKGLFSIGYATKPIQVFIKQLKHYNISAIADVRSVPYSKAFFDYHQDALKKTLKAENIHYVYLGDELGPRSKDESHYDDNNQIQFKRLMQSQLYLDGMDRVQQGLDKGLYIALMCAEKDPADCHRSLLIGEYLQEHHQLDLQHIQHDGSLEMHSQMQERLINIHTPSLDLFADNKEQKELAYQAQCKLKAYKRVF